MTRPDEDAAPYAPYAPQASWRQLAEYVDTHLGLEFTPERWPDLQRGFALVMRELGVADAYTCIEQLVARPAPAATVQVLARHLTVGETYFFRDGPALQALAEHVLPELIRARRQHGKFLRLWCAACCSGEEAYTLAILLHRLLPDLQEWRIALVATDVHAGHLGKARRGNYAGWSFRDAPGWLKPRYFTEQADGSWTIVDEIRRMVHFEQHNLVDAMGFGRPALRTMDIIVCRNVLMYFSRLQAARAITHLAGCLNEGGWLVVAPSEVPHTAGGGFTTVAQVDAILLRKTTPAIVPAARAEPVPPAAHRRPAPDGPEAPALKGSGSPAHRGRPGPADSVVRACEQHARNYANHGPRALALQWCARWIALDAMDPQAHHLHAAVLLEHGDSAAAEAALQRALFLDEEFVMAHVAMGHLARSAGNALRARLHFDHARRLLGRYPAKAVLPASDQLTAWHLSAMLQELGRQESVAVRGTQGVVQ